MSHSSPNTSDLGFGPGDVVQIYAPSVGKPKYHLCICALVEGGTARFLYLNSGSSGKHYETDYVFACEQVPCIPPSSTGLTIVACNALTRYNEKQIQLFNAKRIGSLDPSLVSGLLEFVSQSVALTPVERKLIIDNLTPLIPPTAEQ